MRSWFTMKAGSEPGTADIAIYDEIGFWGVTAADFRDALMGLGDQVSQINLRVNSPGGNVFDGLAIYNMLNRHAATVKVTVDGIAASIASLICMAGDTVEMPENAFMFVHNPAGLAVGTSDDMRDMADTLDKIRSGVITSYTSKTGLSPDEVGALLDAETWMTAAEAKAKGFADTVLAKSKATAVYDLSHFKNGPKMDADPTEKVVDPPVKEATGQQAETTGADGAKQGREDALQVAAACELAGCAEKSAEMIASGKPLATIMTELRAIRATKAAVANGAGGAALRTTTTQGDRLPLASMSWDKTIARLNERTTA